MHTKPTLGRRSLSALFCLMFAVSLATSWAASPIQMVYEDLNNPENNQDNWLETRSIRWDNSEPLELVLFREITGDVLPPGANEDNIGAAEIKRALERGLEQWNDLPGNGFEFDERLRYTDLIDAGQNPPFDVGLDQWNLVTFQNLTVDYSQVDDSGFATASIFYIDRDVDLTEVIDPSLLPFFVNENTASEDNVIFLDLDGDDVAEINLERREYEAGEILDADIMFNQAVTFRLFPEDIDDLDPGITIADIIGEPDLQALGTREFGHIMGGDSSLIPTSIMYSEYPSKIDPTDGSEIDDDRFLMNPYVARDLTQDLDARVLAAILYPDSQFGVGGIEGVIYRGEAVDNVGTGTFKDVLDLVPVFVGRPISFTSAAYPSDIPSNRGNIRLAANVITAVDDGVRDYDNDFLDSTQRYSGRYQFRGLPPASDYGVRLAADQGFGAEWGAPTIYSDGYNQFSDIADVLADWYGGAELTPAMSPDNISDETVGDFSVSNSYLSARTFFNSAISARFTNAETFLSSHSWTFQVITADGEIIEDTPQNRANVLNDTSFLENDDLDSLLSRYTAANNLLGIEQFVDIGDYDNDGVEDDMILSFEVTSLSAETITLNSRLNMVTTVSYPDDGTDDGENNAPGVIIIQPPFVNGDWQYVARTFPSVPAFFESQDNQDQPRIRVRFNLQNGLFPSPSRFHVVSNSQLTREGHPYDFTPDPYVIAGLTDVDGTLLFDNTFEEIAGSSSYFDGYTLGPGESRAFGIVITVEQYDRIPDTGQLLDDPNDVDILDDDPFVSDPVTVSSGSMTRKIDIITNDGAEQPFEDPTDDDDGDGGDGGDDDDDNLDPTDEIPPFDDESPSNGGIALPDDNLFVFNGALGDIDNDGDLDLFLAVSARAEDDFEGAGLANRLYINRIYDRDSAGSAFYTGNRRFDDVTFGVDGVPGNSDDRMPFQQDASYSGVFGDWDKDGDQDLLVLNFAGPGGSNPIDQAPGRQNRLLINQGGIQGGIIGTFEDGTLDFLPGIHNFGPDVPYPSPAVPTVFPGLSNVAPYGTFPANTGSFEVADTSTSGRAMFDASTVGVTGDVNNDGHLDLVIGNGNRWMDAEGTAGLLASRLFAYRDPDADPLENIPGHGPGTLDDGSNNQDLVLLESSERLLINQGFDDTTGVWLGFRDETLGTDDIFGGGPLYTYNFPSIGSNPVTDVQQSGNPAYQAFALWDDRMPPVYYNHRGDDDPADPTQTETDASNTFALALGPFGATSSNALDIYMDNRREPATVGGAGFRTKNKRRSGNDMIYTNIDRTGDSVADGYYVYYNTNTGDFTDTVALPGEDGAGDFIIRLKNEVLTIRDVSELPDQGTSYPDLAFAFTPLMPIGRFDGDIGDTAEEGTVPEPDMLTPYHSNTVAVFPVDFDYRGTFGVFAVNLLTPDDGLGIGTPDGNVQSSLYRINRGMIRGGNDSFTNASRIGYGYFFGDLTAAIDGDTADDPVFTVDTNLGSVGNAQPFLQQMQNLLLPSGRLLQNNNFPHSTYTIAGQNLDPATAPAIPFGTGRPQGGSVADFNLDGDYDTIISSDTTTQLGTDIIFPIDTPGTLAYFDNNGFARFTQRTAAAFGIIDPARYLQMVTGDLDNDGDQDFIVFTLGEGTRVFYNGIISAGPNLTSDDDFFAFRDATNDYLPPVYNQDINPGDLFEQSRRISATTAVDFSDLNRDGFPDFVAVRGGFNTIQGDRNDLYFNTNDHPTNVARRVFKPSYATFPGPGVVTPETFTILDPSTDVALANFNGDIYDDMIVLNRGTESEVYVNSDAEDSTETGSVLDATIYPFDPNGTEPDGHFVRTTPLPFPTTATRQSVAMAIGNFDHLIDGGTIGGGPFDGTGRLDIAIANGPNVRNLLFLNNGDATFRDGSAGLPRIINPFTGDDLDDTRDIVTSDFNGDGNLDLFVLNRFEVRTIEGVQTITKERSRLLFGDGRGTFTDVTAGLDGVLGTSDDRLPLILGEVTSALVGDFDLAGSPTEDLDGDGRLRSHEPEFIERIPFGQTPASPITDLATTFVDFDVQNVGQISDVDISLNIAHQRVSNLRIRLQAPSGTIVTLMDQLGGSGANINTTAFDDEADTAIGFAFPPYGGRFRPQQALSAFDGQSMTGTWRLSVEDLAADDTGTINSVTLSIRTAPDTIDRIEPFQSSYDIFITRAGGQADLMLLNDGNGFFSVSPTIPSVQASSYAAASGNLFLRSVSQDIGGGATLQRPLIDIVVGLDRDLEDGNPIALFLNSAASPGAFTNRSAEMPRVLSTVLNNAVTDDVSGNIRALHLVDGDRDGDLDLYVGQNGRFATSFVGATDWWLENRTIGEGWLNLTRDPGALQPGILPSLRATAASPGGGARGTTMTVRVHGTGFRNGIGVDFGNGIDVLNYGGFTNGWIDVKIRIAGDATLGSRPIVVRDELGLPYPSDLNLFRVVTSTGQETAIGDWELFE